MKRVLYPIIHVIAKPFLPLGKITRHIRAAARWGPRATNWYIDPSVRCNDLSGVTLAAFGSMGAGLEIRIHNSLRDASVRGHVVIGPGVELIGHSTLTAMGGVIEIGENVCMGTHCHVGAYGRGIKIGANVLIASNCNMVDTQHLFSDLDRPIREQDFTSRGIVIEEDVWLGAAVTVMDGVTIGRGAVIGAGAVVTKDIPPLAIAMGVPARVKSFRGTG